MVCAQVYCVCRDCHRCWGRGHRLDPLALGAGAGAYALEHDGDGLASSGWLPPQCWFVVPQALLLLLWCGLSLQGRLDVLAR